MINNLEVELEVLKNKLEDKIMEEKDKDKENIECKEQMITVKDNKGDKIIQLKDAIASFENKYIVKLPFKEILGIRILVKVKMKPNISYKILALVDTDCTKNIIYDKYVTKCLDICIASKVIMNG